MRIPSRRATASLFLARWGAGDPGDLVVSVPDFGRSRVLVLRISGPPGPLRQGTVVVHSGRPHSGWQFGTIPGGVVKCPVVYPGNTTWIEVMPGAADGEVVLEPKPSRR